MLLMIYNIVIILIQLLDELHKLEDISIEVLSTRKIKISLALSQYELVNDLEYMWYFL